MSIGSNDHLITEILNSPSAAILVGRLQSVLNQEKERRELFYNQITEQEKAEFINGEIIIHSPVKKSHNDISGNLYTILRAYVLNKDLGFVGIEKILIQCTRNDYEPDLCYFNKETARELTADQSLFPIPDLIIEILSAGTAKRDRGIKFEDYQNHGVKEYWIIDPEEKFVEQYILNSSGEYEIQLKIKKGEIGFQTVKDLTIPVEAIFDEKLAHQVVKELYTS